MLRGDVSQLMGRARNNLAQQRGQQPAGVATPQQQIGRAAPQQQALAMDPRRRQLMGRMLRQP